MWNRRKSDATFPTLIAMLGHFVALRKASQEREVPFNGLRVEPDGEALQLVGPAGRPAELTYHSFGQLCKTLKCPADFLSDLRPTLAAQVLNARAKDKEQREPTSRDAKLLLRRGEDGATIVDSITSTDYSRVWSDSYVRRATEIISASGQDWRPAPFDRRGGHGLFASLHDAHAVMISDKTIEDGTGDHLFRALMLKNGEKGSILARLFYFKSRCANGLWFGKKDAMEIRIPHRGDAAERAYAELVAMMRAFGNESTTEIAAQLSQARTLQLGDGKDETVKRLFGLRIPQLTKGRLNRAYDFADTSGLYGDPRTPWAMANAVTDQSQDGSSGMTDKRMSVDAAAGRILQISF